MPDQVVWTSADGNTSIDFTDWSSGYAYAGTGTTGLRSPSYEVAATQFAGIDGATVQNIRASVANPTIGLTIDAPDRQAFRAKARGLIHAMRPKAGPGTLTVTTEWGDVRTLQCYCIGGLEGNNAPDSIGGGTWWKMVLQMYAPSPWWLGEERTMTASLGAPTPFFPFFPMKLSSSQVQGQFTVDLSDSDDPAYPVWTITGPGSGLVLTNVTTNRVLTVSASLASGEVMVVDTRPDFLSIRRGDGTNLLGSVTGYPDLWPLIEDVNVVTAALSGATSNSRIAGAYQPRYAGI